MNKNPLNQYDKNSTFNHFFNEFKKETSIISDIFFEINYINSQLKQLKLCMYYKWKRIINNAVDLIKKNNEQINKLNFN